MAPILLVLLRVVQGLGAGAEYAGSVLMIAEHGRAERRGFHTSLPGMGTAAGGLLASGVFALFSTTLSEDAFLSWGWRVPFLLSAVVVAVGLRTRFRVLETPVFVETERAGRPAEEAPLLTLLQHQPKELFISCTVGSAVHLGARSDRLGRRPVYLTGAVALALVAFPMFWLMVTGTVPLAVLGLVLVPPIASDSMFGVQGAPYSELFGTDVRFTGVAVAREFSGALFGGTAPLVATALVTSSGGATWPVSVYVIMIACVTFTAIWLMPETRRRHLGGLASGGARP